MPQVQQFFLEGMRPDMGNMGSLARTMAQPTMQKTFTIRNDVNLKKNTLKLVRDETNATQYHLEFAFDASTDCVIKVFYAATEEAEAGGTVAYKPLKGAAGAHPPESRSKGLHGLFPLASALPLCLLLLANTCVQQYGRSLPAIASPLNLSRVHTTLL